MAALSPLLGGWLTTSLSWRWAFGINIPVGLAVVAGTLLPTELLATQPSIPVAADRLHARPPCPPVF